MLLTQMHYKTAVIVLAREPIKGWGKTRLQKKLSQENVVECYHAFLKDILMNISLLKTCRKFIFYATKKSYGIPFLRTYKDTFDLVEQVDGELNDKMEHALQYVSRLGYRKIILIGSDCVTLEAKDYKNVEKLLDEYSYVLGPTFDGGYYLIGMHYLDKNIFTDIDWSTENVLQQTEKKLQNNKYSYKLLDLKRDIDDIDDLKHISEILDESMNPATYEILRNMNFTNV